MNSQGQDREKMMKSAFGFQSGEYQASSQNIILTPWNGEYI